MHRAVVESLEPRSLLSLSAIYASATDADAIVTWRTDQPQVGFVQYGATASYGASTAIEATPATSHRAALHNLTPATSYHFEVLSQDAGGSQTVSTDYLLTTQATPTPGQVLYNGIVLPQQWPPLGSASQAPRVAPYLVSPPSVINIDTGRQLFVDDFLIGSSTLTRTQHQPQFYPGNPILAPGGPDTNNWAMPFSDGVWFDPADGLFKMWYLGTNQTSVSYAYSQDGVHWTKPVLPNSPVPGTNVVLRISSLRDSDSVWMDLNATDPNQRFKLFAYTPPNAMSIWYSPDGIAWTKQTKTIYTASDRTTVFYNPFRNVWVDSMRQQTTLPATPDRGSYYSRVRYYSESADLSSWNPVQPLNSYWTGPDVLDPLYANSAGESGRSSEVSATPQAGASVTLAINAGGAAAGSFLADADFTGGGPDSTTAPIDTSGVANPAPQSVYQTLRYGDSTYVLPNLGPNVPYTVRLDFAELFATAAGQRVFNVTINGVQVLTNFDIFASAGGMYKALARQFTSTTDNAGKITIQFKTVTGYARINGIEVFAPSSTAPAAQTGQAASAAPAGQISPSSAAFAPAQPLSSPAPTSVTAQAGNGQVLLTWSNTSGANSYNVYRATASGAEVQIASGVTGATFNDTGVANGVTYFYQVTAVYQGANPELYNLDAVAYESVLVGLFNWYYPQPNLVELGAGFSRDGFNWERPTRGSANQALIPASNQPNTWNGYNTQSAGGGFLVVGDELWFYFSARSKQKPDSGVTSTGLAKLRRDGFYSLDAPADGGVVTTRPVQFSGSRLFVNVNDPQGQLQAEIVDSDGNPIGPFTRQNSVPASVNSTLYEMHWNGANDLASLAGRPVQFRFYLTGGSLYSFWVSSTANGASQGYVAAGGPGLTGARDTVGSDGYPLNSPPTNVNAQGGAGSVTLSWIAATGASAYNVYRSAASGSETLLQSGVSGSSFTDSGLGNGATYFYQITAVNSVTESGRSSEVSATTLSPPVAPANLAAQPGDGQVALDWSDSPSATSYNVFRSTTSGGESLVQSGLGGTSFTDTGLADGTTYFYEVTAANGAGESDKSNEVFATPQAIAPATPTNLAAQAGSAQVVLNWTASPGATGYNVYRSNTTGDELLAQSGISGTTFTDGGLSNETMYFYQVTAVNAVGESGRSNEVFAAPQFTPIRLVAVNAGGPAVGSFAADNGFSGGSSDGVGNAVNLTGVTNSAPQSVYQSVRYGNCTYTLANLSPGTAYTVRLDFAELFATAAGQRVFNVAINGVAILTNFDIFVATGGRFKAIARQFTATADGAGKIAIQFTTVTGYARINGIELFTTNPTAPAAPTGIAAKAGNGQATITWNASPGATTYNLYRSTTSGTELPFKTLIGGTSYTDGGLANGTTYYYQVTSVNSIGESGKSSEVSATPQAVTSAILAIDAGGVAAGAFLADADFVGGANDGVSNAIDTSAVTNPAPQAVYQTVRYGNFSYVLPNLTPGAAYTVRFDFAELFATADGQRVFNAAINGTTVLTNFDIFVAAGGQFKAIARQFGAIADSAGKITIQFTTVVGYARVNGIELFSSTPVAPAAPANLSAQAASGQVTLNWTASSGATRYNICRSTSSGTELLVKSGVSGAPYADTGLTNGTTYFYQVTAVNSVGESGGSNEVSAAPQVAPSLLLAIDAGGAAAGAFVADTDFSGGGSDGVAKPVDTSGVSNPAPQAVYQTVRYGNFTYTLASLTPGGAYTVQLDFAELFATAAGQRVFNVAINGTQVLANFDIFGAAAGAFKALAKTFSVAADSAGKIAIQFTTVAGYARVNGIELFAGGAQAAPAKALAPSAVVAAQAISSTTSAAQAAVSPVLASPKLSAAAVSGSGPVSISSTTPAGAKQAKTAVADQKTPANKRLAALDGLLDLLATDVSSAWKVAAAPKTNVGKTAQSAR